MPTWVFHKLPDIFEGAPLKISPGLTILAGPNNSGKSVLLRALRDIFNHPHLRESNQISFMLGDHENIEFSQYMPSGVNGFSFRAGWVVDADAPNGTTVGLAGKTFHFANGGQVEASATLLKWTEALKSAKAKIVLTDPVGNYEDQVRAQGWDDLAQNGRNLSAIIDHLRDEQKPRFLEWKDVAMSILPEVADVFPKSTGTPGCKNLFVRFRRDGSSLPLDQCGTGVAQCLLSLYAVMFAPNHSIVLLDESTHHLHPTATKSFLSALRVLSKQKSVVAATHDPTAIRSSAVDNAILIRPGPKKSMVRAFGTPETVEVLRSLGLDQSDLLFGKGVLVVEGASEEGVLKEAQRNSEISSDIGIASLDGLRFATAKKSVLKDSLKFSVNVIAAAKGKADRVVLLVDNDQRSAERNADIKKVFAEVGPIGFVVLSRRSLENYFLDANLLFFWFKELKGQYETLGAASLTPQAMAAEIGNLTSGGGASLLECDAIKVLNELLSKFLGQGFDYEERKAQYALTLYRLAFTNGLPALKPYFDEVTAAAKSFLAQGKP